MVRDGWKWEEQEKRRQEFQEIGNKIKESQCVFIMLKQDFTWEPHTYSEENSLISCQILHILDCILLSFSIG